MIYQDTWVNGKVVAKGNRECAARYNIVKSHLIGHGLPVNSVLDIGANMCYFGLRLIEDFYCTVMAFEYDHFDLRMANVRANNTNKLMLINRKLSINDLNIMADACRFDLVLAMSVVHHLPGNTTEWLNAFRKVGKQIIVEFALSDSTRPNVRKDYIIPDDATVLGYGDSHLKKNFKRPIVLL